MLERPGAARQEYGHVPVLRDEVVRLLAPKSGVIIVDGTVGLGGHAEAILSAADGSRLIGIDRDEAALGRARVRLAPFGERVTLVHGDFGDVDRLLDGIGIDWIDGLVLDLGISSLQLDDPTRGFSFRLDGPLDMRMDRSAGPAAADWIASASQTVIAEVLSTYGEERYAARIARAIDEARQQGPIETTAALAGIVRAAVPAAYRHGRIDPATRTFQAIRIRVNGELDALEAALHDGFARLSRGGVLAVISFHSLEDRIVKRFFQRATADCICPPELPTCVCEKRVEAEILTKRPIVPGTDEVGENPRARSAKLRAARKVV
jgi:16S rRNA (cytosine1402-N4)-methyltransferase